MKNIFRLSVFVTTFFILMWGGGAVAQESSTTNFNVLEVISPDAAKAVGSAGKAVTSAYVKVMIDFVGSGGTDFCWFCPIFEGMFDAMNNLTTAISLKLSGWFLMVMGVGLLFSIAFKVLKVVTQMQAVDLMQFLTDMFKHLGRAIVATALLLTSLSIYTYLVSPVLSLSMGLTTVILDEGGGQGEMIRAIRGQNKTAAGTVDKMSICGDLQKDMTLSPDVNTQTKAFTPDVRASFVCTLRVMSSTLIFGMALGVVIYGFAFSHLIWGIVPDISYIFTGLIIILAHLAILISFPFKLVDAMIRMAFVTALTPLWIILWVFPATVGYTKKAWDMFLSSCLIFVCLAVVIVLVMSMMQYTFGNNREDLIKFLVAGKDQEAAALVPMGGKECFVIAAFGFLGWKMLSTATQLASAFVGSAPDLGMGSALSQTTVNAGRAAAPYAKAGGAKVMDKIGFDSSKRSSMAQTASKGAGWAAATVATGGMAPVALGMFKGGKAIVSGIKNRVANKQQATQTGPTVQNVPGTPPTGTPPMGQNPTMPNQPTPNENGGAPTGTGTTGNANVTPNETTVTPPTGQAPSTPQSNTPIAPSGTVASGSAAGTTMPGTANAPMAPRTAFASTQRTMPGSAAVQQGATQGSGGPAPEAPKPETPSQTAENQSSGLGNGGAVDEVARSRITSAQEKASSASSTAQNADVKATSAQRAIQEALDDKNKKK